VGCLLFGGAHAATLPISYQTTNNGSVIGPSYGNVTTGSGVSTALPVPSTWNYGQSFAPTTNLIKDSVGNPIGGVSGPNYTFYDDYLFSVTAADLSSVTSTINLGSPTGSVLQISNLQVRLYSGTTPTLGNPGPSLISAWSSSQTIVPGITADFQVLNTTLAAGNYILEVRGNVTGAAGGSYSGVLNVANVTTTPVPVPAAVWLLGSALVGMASISRRKSVGLPR
jgi:hypothetical protein